MCVHIKLYYWQCGHRVKGGVQACMPWSERQNILDARGRCPNDFIRVEKSEGKCDDCLLDEEMGETVEEKSKGKKAR